MAPDDKMLEDEDDENMALSDSSKRRIEKLNTSFEVADSGVDSAFDSSNYGTATENQLKLEL